LEDSGYDRYVKGGGAAAPAGAGAVS
ncbi:hypothetical protein, partial [Frankia sp. CpI1-P]